MTCDRLDTKINDFIIRRNSNTEKLIVKFKFNQKNLDIIRSIPNRKWVQEKKHWIIDSVFGQDLVDIIKDNNIIKIRLVDNKWYLIGIISNGILDEIDNACSYEHPDSLYMQRHLSYTWDGIVHLFNKKSRSFPVGLIEIIKKILGFYKIKYIIEDYKIKHCLFKIKNCIKLRDYQAQVVKNAIESGRCIIPLPVGSGKTLCAIALACYYNKPTIFLCPTKEILYQTIDSFKRFIIDDIKIGIIGDGYIDAGHITIATYQSISSAIKHNKKEIMDYLDSVEVMIADECHHVSSDTFYQIAMRIPAKIRIGLTATPMRTDNTELKFIAAIGKCISAPKTTCLIEQGWLVPADIKIFKLPRNKTIKFSDTYSEIYDKYILCNEVRNNIIKRIADIMIEHGRKVLILVSRIKHGDILKNMIEPSDFIYSASQERKKIYEEMRIGKRKCVIATQIFDEGVDLLAVDCIIIVGGGKSPIKTIQRIGRGLRCFKDKRNTIIIDFIDNARYLYLHSMERIKTYNEVFGNAKIVMNLTNVNIIRKKDIEKSLL